MAQFVKNKWYWISLLVGTAVFAVINVYTPLSGDDYDYTLVPGNMSERCDTVAKYLASMHFFYQDVNGRIADIIGRFFCSLLGRSVFNVFNVTVFAVFVHSVISLITPERKAWVASVVFMYILLLFPWPGHTMLWLSGSVNYMWSATATLVLLRYMVDHDDGSVTSRPVIRHLALAVASFIAGGMNESVSFATLAGMGGYFLFNMRKWRGSNVTITLFYLLGACLILSSPAAWTRLDSGSSVNIHMGFTKLILNRGYNLVTKTAVFVTPLLGLATIGYVLRRKGFRLAVDSLLNCVMAGTMISVIIFGVAEERFYTWYSVMGLIVFASAVIHHLNSRPRVTRLVLAATAVINTVFSCVAIGDSYGNMKQSEAATAAVLSSPDGVTRSYTTRPKSRYTYTLKFNNEDQTCYNIHLGYYLGKENVAFINDSLYTRYRSGKPFLQGGKRLPMECGQQQWARDVYAFEGNDFYIIPLVSDSVADVRGVSSKAYFDHAVTRKGKTGDVLPFYHYHLRRDGILYLVVPRLDDGLVRIEIPVTIGNREDFLVFKHK